MQGVPSSKNLKDFVSRSFNDKKIHLFSIPFSSKTTQTDVNFLISNSSYLVRIHFQSSLAVALLPYIKIPIL